ncbi:sialate O-acetylesterase [Massilia niabensis]|uniref:Sialate O-acetylesterase n=1 Tax=Massilia niabensis TaxID=544910 RepID=A0ABW0LCD8_9BURK
MRIPPALFPGAALLAMALLTAPAHAEVRLPAILSDHMVLQRGAAVPVWGWAAPNEAVSVEFAGQTRATRAGADGRWRVDLDLSGAQTGPGQAPGVLAVRGEHNAIVVNDVLVGEVWLASGQSNMEKPLGEKRGQRPTFDAAAAIAGADHPDIRLFKVAKVKANQPAGDVTGSWVRTSPAAIEASQFSAAAYYFGRRLKQELGTAVGLIDATWGGTRIKSWTPPGLVAAGPVDSKDRPSTLYNGMVAGLAPYGLRGALWYQGESNIIGTDDGPAYTPKMEALVAGWRQAFGAELPFYYVQLAPHLYSVLRADQVQHGTESLPRLREAQADALRIPNTAMIVTTDLADDLRDIHPRDKGSIGLRLANLALAKTYGRAGIEPFGPTFRSLRIQGRRAIVSFDHAQGLGARDGDKNAALSWFEIAGADGRFHQASARVDGDQVVVSSPAVPAPRSVRFGWHEAAVPNLVNRAGLPALPFRSEHPIPSNPLSR